MVVMSIVPVPVALPVLVPVMISEVDTVPGDCAAAMEDLESGYVDETDQCMMTECRSSSLCFCHPSTAPLKRPRRDHYAAHNGEESPKLLLPPPIP